MPTGKRRVSVVPKVEAETSSHASSTKHDSQHDSLSAGGTAAIKMERSPSPVGSLNSNAFHQALLDRIAVLKREAEEAQAGFQKSKDTLSAYETELNTLHTQLNDKNIEIGNLEWKMMGNMQIAELEGKIDGLEDEMKTNNDFIKILRKTIDGKTRQANDLKESLEDWEQQTLRSQKVAQKWKASSEDWEQQSLRSQQNAEKWKAKSKILSDEVAQLYEERKEFSESMRNDRQYIRLSMSHHRIDQAYANSCEESLRETKRLLISVWKRLKCSIVLPWRKTSNSRLK